MAFPIKKATFTEWNFSVDFLFQAKIIIFSQIFEHKPFYVSRTESHPAYYEGLFSTEDLLRIIDQVIYRCCWVFT